MNKVISSALISMMLCNVASASTRLLLANQQTNILRAYTSLAGQGGTTLKELNRYTDANQITHIRMQEYFGQTPVINAQAVLHAPLVKARGRALTPILNNITNDYSMNGNLFNNIGSDLSKSSQSVFTQQQASRITNFVIQQYQAKQYQMGHLNMTEVKSNPIVWVDDHNKAHWAYKVTFYVTPVKLSQLPANPTYMIDATDFTIYKNWDNIKTVNEDALVAGGGFGGNPNTGKLVYDGLSGNLVSFIIKHENGTCFLENSETIIKNALTKDTMQFPCADVDADHNNIYWSADFDAVNQGYSPANDAIFSAQVIKQFYKTWYGIPALINPDGSEMTLVMNVHVPKLDNAYWHEDTMTFGDGDQFYPLTAIDIAVHEVSHGFTEQHSNLNYEGQSGGMNEAFSDMASQTAEYYIYNKNDWQIGANVMKLTGEALRYMDKPSKDCYGKSPGTYCSIDNAKQYYEGLDVHFSSGVYNRAFYLLSNMPNWNPRRAFAVMLQANAAYWVSSTDYQEGAACVVRAASDLHYNTSAVVKAFKAVGITQLDNCTNHG